MGRLPALLAHGLGGRLDLPIPIWQFAWAAAFAVLVSFAILGRFWTVPHLAQASPDTPAPARLQRVARRLGPVTRSVGLVIFLVTMYAGLWGSPEVNLNWAPYAAFILVWVGIGVASAGLGNLLWEAFNPFDTLIRLVGRFHGPAESGPTRSRGPQAEICHARTPLMRVAARRRKQSHWRPYCCSSGWSWPTTWVPNRGRSDPI